MMLARIVAVSDRNWSISWIPTEPAFEQNQSRSSQSFLLIVLELVLVLDVFEGRSRH